MNNPNFSMNDPDELTVAEYAKRFSMSENTVRTKINRKKLKTVKGIRDGRETILIVLEQSMDHSFDDAEQSEAVQEDHYEPLNFNNEQSDTLVSFMRETFSTVQAYSSQIVELSRENERYKLLTDNSSRETRTLEQSLEQLKDLIFEKDAKIKELELDTPIHELRATILQLEAQLADNDSERDTLKSELESEKKKSQEFKDRILQLETLLTEKESLLSSVSRDLESERARGIIPRLFGK